MGLVSGLLLLPAKAPAAGALWVARRVAEAVDQQRNDPAALRAALADAERRLLAGDITEETYDAIETDILLRLKEAGA